MKRRGASGDAHKTRRQTGAQAAKAVGLSRSTLYRYLKEYGSERVRRKGRLREADPTARSSELTNDATS
ncbi:helix-turn-helix domain-containing protein [Arthrobacter monumenti]